MSIRLKLSRPAVASWMRALRARPRSATGSDLVRKVSQTLAVRLVSLAVGMVTTVVLVRALGPSGRGLYAVAGAIGATGLAFANLGLQTSNTYYVSRDRRLLPALMGNSAALSLVVVPALTACTWLIFLVVPSAAPVHGTLLVLGLLAVPIGLAYLLFQNLLLGLQDMRGYNQIELVCRIGGLAVLLGLVAGGERHLGVLFAAGLLPNVAAAAWAWVRGVRWADSPRRPSRDLLRRTLAYGLRAYLGAFFAFMLLRSDLLIVKYKLGAESTGYYSVAVSLADLLYIVPSIVGLVIFPRLAATTEHDERLVLARRVTLWIAVFMAAAAAISAAVARQGIDLVFGRAFSPAAAPFAILAAAMIFYGLNNVVSNYAAASGYPWFAVWIWAIGLGVNVALNLVLIPPLGIRGSALASLGGYGLVAIAQVVYFFRKGAPVARQA
jgi:O-antigen/teichoic acid export membrane protein